ncbi:flagellar biosynthesis protein FlaG [Betaproteobacteria bacterium LSUCC0115]|nr:flagellar biosynthesis protein FlaG [Burkholderiales bacterium LSUCC0115]
MANLEVSLLSDQALAVRGYTAQVRAPQALAELARADARVDAMDLPTPDLSRVSLSRESAQALVKQISQQLEDSGRSLALSVDEVAGDIVTRVLNPNTGELVRSIPSEEMLRISRNLMSIEGLLINQSA